MNDALEQLKRALGDRYWFEREIGAGGMATVYLAHDVRHDRDVAVKVLKPDLARAVGTERFLHEIRITARLNHPHILPLLDSGRTGGQSDRQPEAVPAETGTEPPARTTVESLFYVMPYVAGGSLRRRLGRGPLLLDDALRIVGEVASALEHAHRNGIVHRDVKPENILFSEGLAVVSDFGIAKALASPSGGGVTVTGFPLGTPGYMSPEQAAGRAGPDPRTDVFGLACVVYEMLVGETPELWAGDEELRLGRFVDASAAHRVLLDDLPPRIEQALVRALAMRPASRFASPAAFVEALSTGSVRGVVLPEPDVRSILDRAAELDGTAQPTEPGALSLGGVERIGAEAGIPPAHVRDAARDLQLAPDAPAEPGRPRITKVPVRQPSGKIFVNREVDGELPADAHDALVNRIESVLGFAGSVSGVGRSLRWNATVPGFIGRDVRVSVGVEEGRTRIHIEEHVELRGASIFLPGWGVAGGIAVSVLGMALGLYPEQALPFIAVPAAFAGAAGIITGVIGRLVRRRRPELETLADRLASGAARAIAEGGNRGQRGLPPPGR
jgi:serine/threonine protein kinase